MLEAWALIILWKQHSGSAVRASEDKAQCSQQVLMYSDIYYGRFKDYYFWKSLRFYFIYIYLFLL